MFWVLVKKNLPCPPKPVSSSSSSSIYIYIYINKVLKFLSNLTKAK